MKKYNIDEYLKGIFLLAAGVIILFLPNLLSGLFYFAGAALIIYSVISMAVGITTGSASISITKAVIEVAIGCAIIIFPKFVTIGIPLIAGIFLLLSGVNGFFNALEKRKSSQKYWISSSFSSILMIIAGLFLITNPANVSGFLTKIIGVIFIVIGIALIAREFLNEKKPPENDSVIDVDDFTVK